MGSQDGYYVVILCQAGHESMCECVCVCLPNPSCCHLFFKISKLAMGHEQTFHQSFRWFSPANKIIVQNWVHCPLEPIRWLEGSKNCLGTLVNPNWYGEPQLVLDLWMFIPKIPANERFQIHNQPIDP
jgi:hypothetical protein